MTTTRTWTRRIAGVLASMALATAVVAATTSPAHAISHCNGGRWVTMGSYQVFAPAYGGNLWCLLSQGDYNNWGVVALQNMLRECYGQNIALDGDFGPATRQALLNAQRWEVVVYHENIAIDGIYGPDTKNAVMWPFYVPGYPLDKPLYCSDAGYPF
jgi:hypothetical protein